MGIDRELVENLRRALRGRVEGYAPSGASWGQIRSRTVDQPVWPWAVRVLHWRGMVSAAAAAGMMIFAVATAPQSRLLPMSQSPFVASAARRVVPPVEEARVWPTALSSKYLAPQTYPPLPGWPMRIYVSDEATPRDGEPPIPGRMQ